MIGRGGRGRVESKGKAAGARRGRGRVPSRRWGKHEVASVGRVEGLFRFVSAWFPKRQASLADWHRLPSTAHSRTRSPLDDRRRGVAVGPSLPPWPYLSSLPSKIGRHAPSRLPSRYPRRICVSVRAQRGRRLRFLREAVAAAAATATGAQDDRQPEAVRRRKTDQGAGVQQDGRPPPRVPDTSHHSTWQRISVSIYQPPPSCTTYRLRLLAIKFDPLIGNEHQLLLTPGCAISVGCFM